MPVMPVMIAAGMAPGLWRARRKAHGFLRFRDCDKALAERLVAELEARVRALLRRVQPAANVVPELLQVADLTFDPATLVTERSGQVLRLNPSTRRILQILLQNTQRVVTRQELEAALWGDSPPTGDVLRAHMYALRVAVDKPFDRKLLHTVHGEGYRLAVLDEA